MAAKKSEKSAPTKAKGTAAKTPAGKKAAKSQVRTTRATSRAAKATANANAKRGTSASRWKQKHLGHAPQSARITPPKGAILPQAALTGFTAKFAEDRKWLVVDASGQTVGRLATQIAVLLRGKHKANYTPNNDMGDFVVVVNAEKVKFTGDKETAKTYNRHSGYIGGIKETTPAKLRAKYPERILENAVKGMVPRSPLGRDQMKKLKIYTGEKHPHSAQNPVAWKLRYDSNIAV